MGIESVDTYVLLCHNTIFQYITTHLILELCMAVEGWTRLWVTQQWWEQGSIYLYLEGWRIASRAMGEIIDVGAELEA